VDTLIGLVNGIVRGIIALLIALALVQLVGVIVFVASIIAYHNSPQWYWIASGVVGAGVFLLADVD
jgi:hypothetical protein